MNTKTSSIKRSCLAVLALVLVLAFIIMPLGGCSSSADKYTVTFDSRGGSAVAAQTVSSGDKAKRPVDPTKNGYDFVGWFTDPSDGREWSFDRDTVNKNITLYAHWESSSDPFDPVDPDDPDDPGYPNDPDKPGDPDTPDTPGDSSKKVTVTFNVGLDARKEGVYNPPMQRVAVSSKITDPAPVRAGYTLSGWKVENTSKKWNFATDKLTTDTTLFAEWTKGGAGGGEAESYTPSLTDSNTLFIHYRRANSDYSDWHVWAWSDGNGGKWYEKKTTDKSGMVVPVPLTSFDTSKQIGFLVAKGDWKEKDGEENNLLYLSDAQKVNSSYHWYVDEGNVASGTNHLTKAGSVVAPTVEKEKARAAQADVDRSYAQKLPPAPTATTCDEMGVGYQIFVASFCDSDGNGMGDIRGIINKLDYLDSLNVDVLWLTPVQQSDSSHGYDCYDYYSIDPKFGTNADYRELVYKAHQKGIKVIMDLVVNHTSRKNEWFIKSKAGVIETVTYQDGTTAKVKYRDFYRWQNSGGKRYYNAGDGWYYYSSFGDSMPELNYDCQAVRDCMTDVATYWMGYGLDGFRMDAVKHVYMWGESDDTGCEQGMPTDGDYVFNTTKNVEWFKEFNYRLKKRYPNCFLLGEQLCGDANYVAPFYQGMDSLFDFNTYYDLPGYIDNGDPASAAQAFDTHAALYAANRGGRAINSMISSNHDIPRLYNVISGGDTAKTKLYFAITMTLPGLTWIYYGDEIGLRGGTNNDQYQRQPMKWTSSWANYCDKIPGIANFNINNDVKSVADQEKDSGSLLSYVKSLTKLRNDYPVLINGNAVCSEENGMLKITVSKAGEKTITVYHNFTGSSKSVNPGGTRIFGNASISAYGTAAYRAN